MKSDKELIDWLKTGANGIPFKNLTEVELEIYHHFAEKKEMYTNGQGIVRIGKG